MRAARASQGGAVARLAAWVAAMRTDDIPPDAIAQAKLLLLDTLGCGFAALDDGCAQSVLAALDAYGGRMPCTVLGHPQKMSAPNAVLANGTLIRVLDLNDYVIAHPSGGAGGGHPSDNIPVALAAAELAQASGRDLLAAIVLAYEIYGRGKALMDAGSMWDGVSISGLVAPAIAGRLMNLDPDKLAHAIALGAARAATPAAVREGDISAAKSIANALIAQSGMQATLLAAQGVTGPLDLFEAERGLKAVFDRQPAAEVFGASLPADTFIMHCAIKAYPCFAGAQSAVAAAIALHRRVKGDVGCLATIRVALADSPVVRRQMSDPGRIDPRSREAADHSLQFLIAVALIDGTFGLRQFAGERWNDANVRAVMLRLEMTTDADLGRRAGTVHPCALHAVGYDGRTYDEEILDPPGVTRHGLDQTAVLEKFGRVTAPHLPADTRDRIVRLVMELDLAPTCADFMQALGPYPAPQST
jgi:2-methylcitrate dehydratase